MSNVILNAVAAPSSPAANKATAYLDSTALAPSWKDSNGVIRRVDGINNFSTASQAPAATTRTYITGSNLAVPVGKMRIGSMFRWKFNMTKTGAGIAASTIDVAVGTAGTTADTARVSFTKPAGTAVIDEAWCDVVVTCRGPLSGSGIFVGQFVMVHNLAATGHAVIPVVVVNTVSGAFDVTTANLIVGLCITTGAADVITIQEVQSEAINL